MHLKRNSEIMPVQSRKNQYLGVNAHLHSFWQATKTWNRFHNIHITHLIEALREQLLPLGYVAEIEESLQIRRLDSPEPPRRLQSDVVVYDTSADRSSLSVAHMAELTVAEIIEERGVEHPYFAITLQPLSPDLTTGDAVAWIELLSPTNKGNTEDAKTYLGKRRALLDTGIVFVELDYLHETPPTSARFADYSQQETDAHPYRILVLDPRPDVRHGPANIYEFDVDVAIPTVNIPLNAGDIVTVDFDAPYQQMFERVFYGYNLDYHKFPMNFERYSEADQTRIARRMLAVLEAARGGVNLESAPFPVKDVTLQEALAQIEVLNQ
jgi:hypothetical protein